MKNILTIIVLLVATLSFSQNITGKELLDKAIAYHDPNNQWATFNGKLNITMETPDNPNRDSEVTINLPKEYFNLISKRDTTTLTYTLDKSNCIISKADSLRIANTKEKPRRSHCEMTTLFKNYYTYLYGMPMKLKDPGTILHDKVLHKTFKGKDYLVLRVAYEEGVGKDIWYFYFNPKTYAMEVYQFYRQDENGNEKEDTGEYILLTEEAVVNGIKMPKVRAWYYNKDDKYLGTDILKH